MRFLLFLVTVCLLAQVALAADWPQWRGLNRDGISADVPKELPAKNLLWRRPLTGETHGGIAVAGGFVVVPDCADGKDIFRCYSADAEGKSVWTHSYAVDGELEYGTGARTTPLIVNGKVYTLGAFGDLYCLELATGKVLWQCNIAKDFDAEVPEWGYCSCPLIANGKLIVNPGGEEAALVALNPENGDVIWQTPGKAAAYASFIVGVFGGVKQIIGYDQTALNGWELTTGKLLWTLTPEIDGDYNVGTPVNIDGKLLVATEQNETRLFTFGEKGLINKQPVAKNDEFKPDMATPVVLNGLVYGTYYGLRCMDSAQELKNRWVNEEEDGFGSFSSIIAGNDRLLVFSENGTMFLLAADGAECKILGSLELSKKTWSHPALADNLLFIRDAKWLYCYGMK